MATTSTIRSRTNERSLPGLVWGMHPDSVRPAALVGAIPGVRVLAHLRVAGKAVRREDAEWNINGWLDMVASSPDGLLVRVGEIRWKVRAERVEGVDPTRNMPGNRPLLVELAKAEHAEEKRRKVAGALLAQVPGITPSQMTKLLALPHVTEGRIRELSAWRKKQRQEWPAFFAALEDNLPVTEEDQVRLAREEDEERGRRAVEQTKREEAERWAHTTRDWKPEEQQTFTELRDTMAKMAAEDVAK